MKKHLLLKPLLTLALVLVCGNAWAETESYSLVFAKNSGDGNAVSTETTLISSILSGGKDFISAVTSATKVYCGGSTGLKLGTSSAAGSITFSLSASGSVAATKIVVNAKRYNESKEVSLSVAGGGDPQDLTAAFSDYEFSLNGQLIKNLTLSSTKYCWIQSVTVYYELSNKTLVSIQIDGVPNTLSYYEGDVFDPEGLTVTGHYDDDTDADVTSLAEFTCTPSVLSIGTTSVEVVANVNSISSSKSIVNGIEVSARPVIPVFYESFDGNDGTGGNDDEWSGSIATNTIAYDNAGWVFANGTGANKCAKFGAGSKKGSATTPEIYFGTGGKVLLTFKAGAWDGNSETTTLNISAVNCSISQSSVTLVKGEWSGYTIDITDVTGPVTVTFEAAVASNNRFFLDEVKMARVFDVYISDAKYATLCLPFKFTVPAGVTAYTGAATNDGVTLTAIEGVVPANKGVILYSETAGTYTFTGSAETPATLGTNDLVGVTEATAIPEGSYILALDDTDNTAKFFKIDPTSNTLAANKAYLAIPSGVTPSKALAIRRGDATGIETIMEAEEAVYIDLMGRKVANPTPGIYILGGKKVMVK